MHQDLQRLTNELRKERCPQRVLDEVTRRIAAQGAEVPAHKETKRTKDPVQAGHFWLCSLPLKRVLSTGPRRFKAAFGTAALVVICSLVIRHQPTTREKQQQPEAALGASLDRARVARQAEGALGYIGCVLLDAGVHTKKIVLNQAVPPLRNSVTIAREKLLNHIQP